MSKVDTMLRKWFVITSMILLLLISGTFACAQDVSVPDQAAKISENLFKMLDEGKLKETFSLAAPSIREIEDESLWMGHMISERESMGTVEERTLDRVEQVARFADLPKGEYLMLTYKTRFSTHPQSEEMVVLAPQPDGSWGLVGYKVQYNRWPEAGKIILNGLFLVFFIMGLLALLTWGVGRLMQNLAKKPKQTLQEKKG